jgi:hypothetical protein
LAAQINKFIESEGVYVVLVFGDGKFQLQYFALATLFPVTPGASRAYAPAAAAPSAAS